MDTSEHVVITYMTTGETPTGTKDKYDEMIDRAEQDSDREVQRRVADILY